MTWNNIGNIRGPQGETGPQGEAGPVGGSAYDIAISGGFVGTEAEWLASLGGGGVSSWNDLTDKPATFPPSDHDHPIADVTGLQAALDGKQPAGSYATAAQGALAGTALQPGAQIPWTDVTGKPMLFSGAYGDLSGIPSTFTPSAHGHVIGDVTGLQVALDGKQAAGSYAAAVHGHAIGDVTGLQGELDGKQPLATVLTSTTASFTTAQETKLAGIATGATANATDAALRDRATHTGTQIAATISDFAAAVSVASPGTNLSYTAATRVIASDTGTDATLPLVVAAGDAGLMSGADKTKLDGIATGATANATDAALRGRATHTGTQLAATISDFASAVASTAAVTANTAKVTNATHTGDVTGATALTIANDAVTNAKLANMATASLKGRATAGTGDPEDLTGTQATALLNTFTSGAKGLVPASGGGTTNFLRADGTFAAPAGGGGGGGSGVGSPQFGGIIVERYYDGAVAADNPVGRNFPANTVSLMPFSPTRNMRIDEVGVQINTAGASGALLRHAIYATGSDGFPGAKLWEAGASVAADSTGFKGQSLNFVLDAGVVYWFGVAVSANVNIFAIANGSAAPILVGETDSGGYRRTVFCSIVYANALPDPFITLFASLVTTAGVPRIMMRAAEL